MLKQTLDQELTDQELINSGTDIRAAINKIDESPTDADWLIQYHSDDVSKLLDQKPDDADEGRERWVQAERKSLKNLLDACVYAGYITR
jgi:hypothetical protein